MRDSLRRNTGTLRATGGSLNVQIGNAVEFFTSSITA